MVLERWPSASSSIAHSEAFSAEVIHQEAATSLASPGWLRGGTLSRMSRTLPTNTVYHHHQSIMSGRGEGGKGGKGLGKGGQGTRRESQAR
jgi:hypothetical protein